MADRILRLFEFLLATIKGTGALSSISPQRELHSCRWKCILLVACVCTVATSAWAQSTTHVNATPTSNSVTPAIPLAEVSAESESALAYIRALNSDLLADRSLEIVRRQLPPISREIDNRLRESRKIFAQFPSIEVLRGLAGEWNRLRRELAALNADLTSRVNELQRSLAQLDNLKTTWDQTAAASKKESAPPELTARIETVRAEILQAREGTDKQRGLALTLQSRVGVQDSRVADVLTSIEQAREKVLSRLFLRDGLPIWRIGFHGTQSLQNESWRSLLRQWEAFTAYAERQTLRFAIAGVILAVLSGALFWTRRSIRALQAEEIDLTRVTRVFEIPIAGALILLLLSSRWIFPQAPRLLWAMLGALALIPSVIILRQLVSSHFYPVLYTLVGFFFIDQLRTVTAAVQVLPRLLFLFEMLGVAILSGWILRCTGNRIGVPASQTRLRWAIRLAAKICLVMSVVPLFANAFGYIAFSNVIGSALLDACYVALILYAIVEILDGLVTIALRLRPFSSLSAVSRHRSLLRHRIRRVLESIAQFLWIIGLLQSLLLLDQAIEAIQEFLNAQFVMGSISISPGDALAFIITVWAAFLVSRFIRFLLDEDIYPRIRLKRGLSYAISQTLHYLILMVGFFVAVAALGLDMTRVTILVGAFSVGVGFGLQNIFNNFISGLILLFERPINIGDIVQIEDASGVVERIGIRASVIRTTNGSEIIMPNGKLISERLINWTLSSSQHGIELPVAVASSSDPAHVGVLLERTAATHPLVSREPPPQALVVKLGQDSLGFELRAWTNHSEQWMQIRSELAIAVKAALATEKIAIR